jgi:ribosomal-protein-alanine N-acetyltransferase
MNGWRTVPAGLAHAGLLAELHQAAFAEQWSAATLGELLAMPGAFAWLAGGEETARPLPVGFVLGRMAGEECEILTLAVMPAARRRGAASALLEAALSHAAAAGAKAVFLEVAESNRTARRLYARGGFALVGRRKAYYHRRGRTPLDALILRRAL